MKLVKKISLLIFFAVYFFLQNANSQADTINSFCSQFLPTSYISDGQQYQALLVSDEIAEFRTTFYGGATYRIVACSGLEEGDLSFRLYDTQRNLLFENTIFGNTPYWDFKFQSTVDCIIEAELNKKYENSGFAIILIGFKP